jgi:serine protease Do
MQISVWKRTLISASVIAALSGGYVGLHAQENTTSPSATTITSPSNNLVPQSGFRTIVERNGAAVVNISITGTMKTSMNMPSMPQMDPNNPLYQFFRQFQNQAPNQGDATVRGLGSGFIISPDGVILTNAHVIDHANEVTVKLTDKREFKAKVLGKDVATDVAVLKIDATDLPTVTMGNPAQSQVGDWVLAIGSPFGFENSATAGIISAKSRTLPDDGYVQFLQTDVPVNPGNSGGPLFNSNGQVIGINSQIYTRTGGYEGLSFAIPIDVAMKVEEQIVKSGKVERGLLGVTIQEVNQSLASSFGLKKPMGALVGSVEDDGPAAKAGIKAGDVILKFNGATIADSSDLPPMVANTKPGSNVKLDIWRNGKHKELSVALGDLSKSKLASNDDSENLNKSRLGVAVRPLTPDERKQANVREGGLLVEEVGGPAAAAGIQPGDVILSLNGEHIDKVSQLRKLIAKHGKHVALLVQREHSRIFVPVDLG